MRTWKTALSICAVVVVAVGCDSGEMRPLNYEKGVYKGEPHTPLSEEKLSALRARAAYQGGFATASGGGVTAFNESPVGSDVRPPGTPRDGN